MDGWTGGWLLQDPVFDVNALEEATGATLLHHAAINSKMRVLECVQGRGRWA